MKLQWGGRKSEGANYCLGKQKGMDPGHSLRVGHSWSRRGTALAGNSLASGLEGSGSRWEQINGRIEGIKAPCDWTLKCEPGAE